jgi:lysophospholipase L1-like esterase
MSAREAADPRVLAPDAAAALLRDAPYRRLALLGDSLVAAIGDPTPGYAPLYWPQRLEAALRPAHPDLAVLNTGVIGARVGAVRESQLDRVLAFGPDLAGVIAGGNDMFAADPDYAATEATLDALHGGLRAAGARVFTITLADVYETVPAMAGLRERLMVLNDLVRAVAGRHGSLVVEMWDHPARKDPELMSQDGIHFTALGHAVLGTEIIRALAGPPVDGGAADRQA